MAPVICLLLAGGFVVVAPERFHEALADYVKRKKPVELASLESILKGEGADDPEKLKRWLYAAWKERKIRYVLLVGDADLLPVRYMVLDRVTAPAFDTAFYPCDLYYADVARSDGSFDDWNGTKNAYYGEVRGEKNKGDPINYDGIDYRPELALGRWPVSTVEEVKIVAAKSLAHAPRKRAAFVCVDGWVDQRERLDAMARGLGWDAEKRYFKEATEEALVKLLNEGVGLMCHTGHGADDQWAECFSTASLAKLKNADRLPVMMSAGCSTARFATLPPYEAYVDVAGVEHKGTNHGEEFKEPPPPPAPYQKGAHNPTGLGEQLLRAGPNGAVAYIGCNTGSQPCGVTLIEGFVGALPKSARLGDAWAEAVAFYFEREKLAELKPNDDWYPPSIFFQGMKFMLFGDPTLEVS